MFLNKFLYFKIIFQESIKIGLKKLILAQWDPLFVLLDTPIIVHYKQMERLSNRSREPENF